MSRQHNTSNIISIPGAGLIAGLLISLQVSGSEFTNGTLDIRPEFSGYDISDGLSSNVADAILEDSRGFIWIGTQDGLNRFDGYEFHIYGIGAEGSKFMSHLGIKALLEDKDGYIWIGTAGGGLNCYDPETEQFWYFFHNPDDTTSLSDNTITSLVQDEEGTVWVGTSYGLNRMHKTYNNRDRDEYIKPLNCTFTNYDSRSGDPSSLSNSQISCLYIDRYRHLWVGTANGLNLFLPEEGGKFIRYTTEANSALSLSHNNINAVYEDINGDIWVGSNNGLNQLTARGNNDIPTKSRHIILAPWQQSSVEHNHVGDIIADQEGNLWLGTIGGGLNVIPRDHLSENSEINLINYYPDDLDPKSIHTNTINSLILASTGDIWFASNHLGIGLINTGEQIFQTLRHNPKDTNSLSNNVVKSIIEDRSGNFWIGTWGGGMVKYTPEINNFKSYEPDQRDPDWLGSDIIQVIVQDNEGIMWIGTQGMGLYRFNPETEVFKNIRGSDQDGNSFISNDIWSICPGRDGSSLWIGTLEGLDRYDIRTGIITNFFHEPEDEQSISFNEIRSLYEDKAGNLWIGTGGGGLDRLEIKNHFFHHHRYRSADSTSLSNNSIYSIFEDSSGNLWIGTLGGGISKIEASEKYADQPAFQNYGKKEGLANDVVKGILEDEKGNLWISTTNGLSKFNPRTKTFVNYSESDGLQSNVFNLGASCKSRSGQLFFGGVNGLTIFHPDSIPENTQPPRVFITDLKISNRSISVGEKGGNRIVLDRSILMTEEIELSHQAKVISFDYTAVTYTAQEKIKYAYRLTGYHEKWHETNFRERSITYPDLKPGEYVFEVKASNTDGEFMDNSTSVSMIVRPAFYRTKAALAAYVLLILAGLAYSRQITRKRMRLKFEVEQERLSYQRRKEVDEMKLQFFTNISHEFRTPLTLLFGPLQKLRENVTESERKKQYGIMEKNIDRMLRLVNQIIDFRKMDQGALEFKATEGNVIETIKEVCSLFEEMASAKKIKYDRIFYEKEINTWYDPDKIEKILSNILSNAFKYSSVEGKILVEADICRPENHDDLSKILSADNKTAQSGTYFYISVTDTGRGIREKDLDLIFKRFYKADDKDLMEYGGTGMGIGLSLVEKLVEMHHGEIHVKSELNRGSSFTVFIPMGKEYLGADELSETDKVRSDRRGTVLQETILMEEELADNGSSPENPEKVSVQGDRKKLPLLLLVEDDYDLLEYLQDNLMNRYRIHTATDGVQALKSVVVNHPELVISDIMMPEMDGIELTNKIKTDIRISHIPVILLTAKSTLEHRLEGLDIGADAYLTKPFHLTNLYAQIENLLKSRKILREKFIKDDQVKPEEISLKSIDQKYLEKAIATVEKFMEDPVFTVEKFAQEMFDSRVQLYRKLKGLTGLSPNEFVRNIRIKRAAEILIKEGITVGEVMYRVGFSNRSYFNRCFRQVYDTSPMDYQNAHQV
jgi:signal transduction histidine kinase/ligand-binding sensor domain-containing protein/AraC-like DNA-binding protein